MIKLCWRLLSYLHRQIEGVWEQKKSQDTHTVHRVLPDTEYYPAQGLSRHTFHISLLAGFGMLAYYDENIFLN